MAGGLKTVTLYRCAAHQLANSQYKIGNWSTYSLGTVSNVKVTGDLQQVITLPYDLDFETINAVGIDSKIYDVIGIEQSTLANGSTRLRIQLNPISTYITTGTTIAGYWERLPTDVATFGRFDVGYDSYKESSYVAFDSIPTAGSTTGIKTYYLQITARYDITTSSSSNIRQYGCFVFWHPEIMSWSVASTGRWACDSADHLYPGLIDIINNIDTITGITSDTILNVSLSPRCPYDYIYGDLGGGDYGYQIKHRTAGNVTLTAVTPPLYVLNVCTSNAKLSPQMATSKTLTLTDYQRYCGRITIKDEYGNEICEIPNEIFNSSNNLTYYVGCFADVTGLYTYVKINNDYITFPEGQLPWTGDAWQDYMSRTYAYDREMLDNNIRFTKEQTSLNNAVALSNGVMNATYGGMMGAMSGNPVGAVAGVAGAVASTGIQMYANNEQSKLDIRQLKSSQKAKEGLIKNGISSNYQAGYGLDYLYKSFNGLGARISIETPSNITSTDFTNYVNFNGYPANLYKSLAVTTGYYKGNINTEFTSTNGPALDLLRREFAEGVRLV